MREGKRLAAAKGVKQVGQLCTADVDDLPFADGWFDAVFIASAVHHPRTPERVLRDMLRVLRPGGVLQLHNEPVGREFCVYAFNSNQAESFTALERALDQAELMRTVSSPFFGTRPEEMFQSAATASATLAAQPNYQVLQQYQPFCCYGYTPYRTRDRIAWCFASRAASLRQR